ncbi:MAG: RHS repeat-associated core domain-containing protein, partial [Planctomycetota bacterium]
AGATTAMNLTWDSDNKLRSADIDANGTADVNFQYDALGRRVARSGTGGSVVFVQMDQQTIADYPVGGAATTPTFRYVYGSYIDEPVVRKTAGTGGTLVYFHRNHQYSVTAITTSTGAIAERYSYTAYGQPTILNASGTPLSPQTSTLNSRYSYTGREWDATLGLHHFRARWMSPIAGRFLGRDPIGLLIVPFADIEYVVSREKLFRNLYSFLAASPVLLLDAMGLYPTECPACTNRSYYLDGIHGARIKCCEYYPECKACNGLWETCFCRSNDPDPTWDQWDENGCTGLNWPWRWTIFTPACTFHDYCWNRCGADQAACDRRFYQDLIDICLDYYGSTPGADAVCFSQAWSMYQTVQNMKWYFEQTQDKACLWKPCGGKPKKIESQW